MASVFSREPTLHLRFFCWFCLLIFSVVAEVSSQGMQPVDTLLCDSLYSRALALRQSGSVRQAFDLYASNSPTCTKSPYALETCIAAIWDCEATGNFLQQERVLVQGRKMFADNPTVAARLLFYYAHCQWRLHGEAAAREYYDTVCTVTDGDFPEAPQACSEYIEILTTLNQFESTLPVYRRLSGLLLRAGAGALPAEFYLAWAHHARRARAWGTALGIYRAVSDSLAGGPQAALVWFRMAECQVMSGDTNGAFESLRSATTSSGDAQTQTLALLKIADLQIVRGKIADAILTLRRCLDDPKSSAIQGDPAMRIAMVYAKRLKEQYRAAGWARQAATLYGQGNSAVDAYLFAAAWYDSCRAGDSAIAMYTAAVERDTTGVRRDRSIGRLLELYVTPSESDTACDARSYAINFGSGTLYRQVIRNFDSAVAAYTRALAGADSRIDSLQSLYYLAVSYALSGRWVDFNKSAEIWMRRYGENSAEGRNLRYFEAENLFTHNKYVAAAAVIKKSGLLSKESQYAPDAVYLCGRCYFYMHQSENAIEAYRTCAWNFPRSVAAQQASFAAGAVFASDRQYDSAAMYFGQAAQRSNPDAVLSVAAACSAAICFRKTGAWASAAAMYVERYRKIPLTRTASDAMTIAFCYAQAGMYDMAFPFLRDAELATPYNKRPEVIYWQGECLRNSGRYTEALKTYSQVPALYPRIGKWDVTAYMAMAKVYTEQNRCDQAIRMYDAVASLDGANGLFGRAAHAAKITLSTECGAHENNSRK